MTDLPRLTQWLTLPEAHDTPALVAHLSRRGPKVAEAVQLAIKLHSGQSRAGSGLDYISHPLSVAALCSQLKLRDNDELITAVLHDTLEDCDITVEAIESRFGAKVARQVALLTKTPQNKARYFEDLRAAPRCVRLIKGLDRYHNLLTIGEDRKERYVLETRQQILPLLGNTPAERYLSRLLQQLIILREAGGQKLAIPRDSDDGRWVEQTLERRAQLDFDQIYRRAKQHTFARRNEKADQLLFMVGYVVTARDQVALFHRSTLRDKGGLSGRGALAAVTPVPGWPTEIGVFSRLLCARNTVREIRPLGQGVSDVGSARYVFELYNVVLKEPTSLQLLSAKDRFSEFVPLSDADVLLGEHRALDQALLQYLRGEERIGPELQPTSLRTSIRDRLFLGMDIVSFSTLDTFTQVAELLRLHKHLRAELSRFHWKEPLVFSPTGDGCFLSASPHDLSDVLTLAGRLRHRLERANEALGRELRLRFGLNRGPAFSIRDINGAENLIGDGINMAARMLDGKEPWEMNVPQGVLDMDVEAAAPVGFEFTPAQLDVKHYDLPMEVLRCDTPELSGLGPQGELAPQIPDQVAPGEARDGGVSCKCIELSELPHYTDYESTELGIDPADGRFAEVSLQRCVHCGRVWLRYFWEHAGYSHSGQWYRGLLAPDLVSEISARNATHLLGTLEWHQYGGSYYDGRFGLCEGAPTII